MRYKAKTAALLSAALLLASCAKEGGNSKPDTSSVSAESDAVIFEFAEASSAEDVSSIPEQKLEVSCQVTLNNANGGEISSEVPEENARILYEMISEAADKPTAADVSDKKVLTAEFTANGEHYTLTLCGSDTFGWQSGSGDTVYFKPDSTAGDRIYGELSAYCAVGVMFPDAQLSIDAEPFESKLYTKVKSGKEKFFEQQSHYLSENEVHSTLISHSGSSRYFCSFKEYTDDPAATDPDSFEVITDGVTAYERTGTDESFSSYPADEVITEYPYFADNVKYYEYLYSFAFRKGDDIYTVECLRSDGQRQYLVFNMQENPCGGWNISDNGADIMTYYFMSEAPVNFDELFAGVK